VRIIWSEIAQVTFFRFIADQAGMMAVNGAVEGLTDDPAPPGAFVRGAYRKLRVGPYRVPRTLLLRWVSRDHQAALWYSLISPLRVDRRLIRAVM
jgi:hypothetical protein